MNLLTGEGFWSPLVWLALAVAVTALTWWFRSKGRQDYKKGTEQATPFLSGEPMPEGVHVGGQHLYWGFVEALRPFVERIRAFHTGVVVDYVTWLVVMLAVVFLVVMLS